MDTKPQRKGPLRFSVPPYWVGAVVEDTPILSFPGCAYEITGRLLLPSAAQVREILLALRADLRWSRAALAAFLGVSRDVVRRWETGERNPSGAARRLIWLLNMLVRRPDKLRSAMDLVTWGKSNELAEFSRILAPLQSR